MGFASTYSPVLKLGLSRLTAVLTAIMDLSAGGRLYKCLYKMHVASRAFWGAFWGAFRVFLRDVG